MDDCNLLSINFTAFGSDKNTDHSYGHFYDAIFEEYDIKFVLEIGVLDLAGMKAFESANSKPVVFGIDCEEKPFVNVIQSRGPEYIEAVLQLRRFRHLGVLFDLIVDDASHTIEDQIAGANQFFEFLSPGGIYVIEDLQTQEAIDHFVSDGWNLVDLRSIKNRWDDVIVFKMKNG